MEPLTFVSRASLGKIPVTDTSRDFLSIQYLSNNFALIDRTQTIPTPFEFKVKDQYKILYDSFPSDCLFKQACLQSAVAISNHAGTRKIYIFWSGGIDSTLVIASFLLAGVDASNIVIVCNQESIQENPKFWKHIVCEKFSCVSTDEFFLKYKTVLPEGVLVEANPAETTFGDFGPKINSDQTINTLTAEPSTQNLMAHYEKLYPAVSPKRIEKSIDVINLTVSSSPAPIATMFDWLRWVNVNFIWISVNESLRSRVHAQSDTFYFFNAPDMQKWASKNVSVEYIINKYYKHVLMKEIIFEIFEDSDYFDNKIKWPSVSRRFLNRSALFSTTNHHYYIAKEFENFLTA